MNNLEKRRKQLGYTQNDVIRALGISKRSYFNYTRDRVIPSDVLIRMTSLFRCSADYLLGIEKYTAITIAVDGSDEVIADISPSQVICKTGYHLILSDD